MFAIPSAAVAAVILTNSDRGGMLRGPFLRRLMEVLYDGRPEAATDLETAVKNFAVARKEFRAKLQIPGDTAVLGGLAARYRNVDLGTLDIKRGARGSVLHANTFTTAIATKKNEDGTYSLIASDPPLVGAEWVVGTTGGKRTLTLRAGQHVYVFTEA
jgi:hypothetical protein